MLIKIKSETDEREYIVDLKELTCTCSDFKFRKQYTGELCKHIEKALQTLSGSRKELR